MINGYAHKDYERYAAQNVSNMFAHSADFAPVYNEITELAYVTLLLGAEKDLTMHGGGNTSVKFQISNGAKEPHRVLCVKASGTPLNLVTPNDFVALDLDAVCNLKTRTSLTDKTMASEFEKCKLLQTKKLPSIESLMHAFINSKFVLHSHPTAILKIVNRKNGAEFLKQCFGDTLAVIPYAKMGFDLANAVYNAYSENPSRGGVVIRHHGLVTWGENVQNVYSATIEIITKAEEFLQNIKKENPCDIKTIIRNVPMTPDYPMPSQIFVNWSNDDDVLIASCGSDETAAQKTSDYIRQAISIRRAIIETGGEYEPLGVEFLRDMQYRSYQTTGA